MFSSLIALIMANMLFFCLHLESRTLPKPLTPKEEKEEFEKYNNGDKAARDKLIKHNLRLVAHVTKKYCTNLQDTDDMISIGTIGLIKAVESYSSEKNTRFSTYRARCIENEVLMSLRKNKGNDTTVSLEENLELNNDTSRLSLKDSVEDDFDIEEYCLQKENRQQLHNLIVRSLPARERQVLVMRYGLGGSQPMTQQQICEILGISRSYVSRLETKAINTLRKEFE